MTLASRVCAKIQVGKWDKKGMKEVGKKEWTTQLFILFAYLISWETKASATENTAV